MNTQLATPTNSGTTPKPPKLNRTLWALQIAAAAFFGFASVPKLFGAQVAVDAFDEIGAGEWLRILVGLLELAGAVGLLSRRLSGLAASGLALLMIGATATNVLITNDYGASIVTVTLCSLFCFIARQRWSGLERSSSSSEVSGWPPVEPTPQNSPTFNEQLG